MPQRQRRRSSNAKASPDVDPQSPASLRKPTLRVMAKLDAATITTESEPSASGNSPQANVDDGLELTVDPSGAPPQAPKDKASASPAESSDNAEQPNSWGPVQEPKDAISLSPSETSNANSLLDSEGSAQRPGLTSSPSEPETSNTTNQLDPEGPVQRARKTSSPPVPSADANASNVSSSDGAASSPSTQTQTSQARDQPDPEGPAQRPTNTTSPSDANASNVPASGGTTSSPSTQTQTSQASNQPDPEGPAQRSRNTSSSSTPPPADAEAATLHASLPTPPGERSGSSSRSASTSSLDVFWERPGSGARTSPSQRQLSITTSTRSSPSEDSAVSSDETQTSKPRRKALARILRVGDRVKRGPDMPRERKDDKGKAGTVTARPSELAKEQGVDPTDWVDVRWDAGGESCYRMGLCGRYDLDLA